MPLLLAVLCPAGRWCSGLRMRLRTARLLPHTLFSDDAAALIHATARGYPRAVNNIATQALIVTYTAGKTIVDQAAACAAVTEVTDD